jgi:hypothetical protein
MILERSPASDYPVNGVLPKMNSKNMMPMAQTSPFSVCPYCFKAYGDI